MKFIDPKTGVKCLTIRTAILRFCGHNSCPECPLFRFKNRGCHNWTEEHPADAARLMGYEVIDDSSSEIDETPTDTPTTLDDTPTGELVKRKPRLAEVLGVEVGEEFIIREGPVDYKCVINQDGEADLSYWKIGYAINHPESIIRAPRLTEAEIAIMRAVGAKWASRDDNCDDGSVDLWGAKPLYGDGMYNNTAGGGLIATIRSSALFPSVNPGDCIELEEET